MTEEIIPAENIDEELPPMKVEITNHPKEEIKDNTSWETKDEWDAMKMTEEDIKEAEESRNA